MKEQKIRKLHNPETGGHWYMRIVSLLLVAVLLWVGLENTILQVHAEQEKGSIKLSGDVLDEEFWHGTANNNKPCWIQNIDMQITQKVENPKVQIKSSGKNVETKLSDGTVTAKYLDEDATFSMTFNSNVDYHLNSYSVKYRTKRDYSYAAQYDRFTVAQTRTYYKLVTRSDSSDGSAEFEAAVRKIYGPDCNKSVLMAKNKDGNHTFSIAVANAAKETGYQLYQPGMKLPLMTDGKEVVRVDMLTVSEGDLYISGEGRFWGLKQTNIRFEYAAAIFKVHSYKLSNTAKRVLSPTAVLESGKNLSSDAISADDTIIRLDMAVPSDLTEEEKTSYTTACQGGKLQYVLSDKQIANPSEIEDWKDWNGSKTVDVKSYQWLYLRSVPKSTSENIWRNSEVKEYGIKYLLEPAKETTITLTSSLQLANAADLKADKATLQTDETDGQILYTTNGKKVSLQKVPYSDTEKLKNHNEEQGMVTVDGKKYIRLNGLWYRCGDDVETYTEAFSLPYDKNGLATIHTMVVKNGRKAGGGDIVHEVQKLQEPYLKLESGATGKGESQLEISLEDRITGIQIDNPYTIGSTAFDEYEEAGKKAKIQYYFSDTPVSGNDLESISWKLLKATDLPLEFPDTDNKYLYLKVEAPDTGFSRNYVSANIICYQLTYKEPKTWSAFEITTQADQTVTEDGKIGSGVVQIKAPADWTANTVMVYTLDADDIQLERVEESTRTSLNQKAEGTQATVIKDETGCYVRVNRIWYRCKSKGEVLLYDGKIQLTKEKLEAKGASIYVIAAADGYLPTNWTYHFQGLEAPGVTLESGKNITTEVSEDDTIIAFTHEKSSETGISFQYYLTDQKLDEMREKLWTDWDGKPVDLGRNKYLYVRVKAQANSGYMTSVPKKYSLKYITAQTGKITATAYMNGQEIKDGVDIGDQIELIELTSTESNALIFYTTVDGSNPSFTKVVKDSKEWIKLTNQDTQSSCTAVVLGTTQYVKVNGLWYRCEEGTYLYDKAKKIVVDESIYKENILTINAQSLADGYVIGNADRFSYGITLRNQAPSPTASVADGTTIKMGDRINLLCNEGTGYRIFFTTNGSAPVVNIIDGILSLGPGTYEFKAADSLRITTDFASYGSTATITAIACKLGSYTVDNVEKNYRIMKDSAIARFTYMVEDQAVVEPVLSIPATSSENRTTVKIGSKIRLYSNTEGAVIFYTMDGTEPFYGPAADGSGMEAKSDNTKKYNASQGITVPEIGDSSIITITAVAYCKGLASSNISRLIFQYPAAVTAPYATPSAGAVTENTQVTLKTATEGAVIYYEVAYGNDTPKDPTESSNVYDSSNPFVIGKKTTIKAYAVKDGMKSEIVTFAYTVSDKLSVPTPSIDTGAVVASGTVIELEADKDATIYYTVDGSDPKKSGNKNVLIGTNVILSGKAGDVVSLRTYASRTGYSDSEVGYYSYSISGYDGGIFADKETGSTVKNGEVIHLNTDVSKAKIYYTTDGSTPTESSTQGSAVTIQGTPGENITIKAIAVASGTDKAVSAATFTYQILDKLAAPTSSVPDGAVFTSESVVELTVETGKIYYTTNGEDPTTASNLYKKNITVDRAVTIKAIAVAEDYQQSEVSTFSYGFASQVSAPVASYASGELDMGTEVAFTCETEGASIYYRTDGAEPDLNDKNGLELYTGPLEINRATNFKVIAVKDHMQNSKVLTVGYTVREPEVIVEAETEETTVDQGDNGRLMSRRSYSDTESGPSYTDVVLKNATYGVVVASEEGTIPDNVQLKVDQVKITDTSERMVKQMLSDSYGVVAGFDVQLQVNGEAVQPDGEIEIGLPIPAEYENTLIQIVYLAEDGSVQFYSTRRSGGVAYIKTNHLSTYAIAAPVEFQESGSQFPWLLVGYSTAVALTAVGILLFYRVRKMKREDEEEDG